jgi:cold shock CspA family protein
MPTGTLKMWNADRDFGFIKDDSGGVPVVNLIRLAGSGESGAAAVR